MIPVQTGPVVDLGPGGLHFALEPTVVRTILGSCVSVVMYDPVTRIGAISHALLPECDRQGRGTRCLEAAENLGEAFKYVDCSTEYMLSRFEELGVGKNRLSIMLFGGSAMVECDSGLKIGKSNIVKAYAMIERTGLTVGFSDVGGCTGRKLFFHTHTGDVVVKQIKRVPVIGGSPYVETVARPVLKAG